MDQEFLSRFARRKDLNQDELIANATRLSRRGGGILASDESNGTMGKRLISAGLQNDEDTRRDFRELLYTGEGLGDHLNGAIMYHETFYQSSRDGKRLVDVLREQDVLVGIKVDQGLEGLDERCRQYYKDGARFAKWRAVIKIDPVKGLPSMEAIDVNAKELASYAKIAQGEGLVPLVEPEILIEGTHSAEVSSWVAEKVIGAVYQALRDEGVLLEGTLLKPMMILPGASHSDRPSAESTAALTLQTILRCVPPAVPGIMFLSGGMSESDATQNLHALNQLADSEYYRTKIPWNLSFSFGRALQSSVLNIWGGKEDTREDAKRIAVALAKANAQATLGQFSGPHPSVLKDATLIENFRGWRAPQDPDTKA